MQYGSFRGRRAFSTTLLDGAWVPCHNNVATWDSNMRVLKTESKIYRLLKMQMALS